MYFPKKTPACVLPNTRNTKCQKNYYFGNAMEYFATSDFSPFGFLSFPYLKQKFSAGHF
jgi:hypothetical protein